MKRTVFPVRTWDREARDQTNHRPATTQSFAVRALLCRLCSTHPSNTGSGGTQLVWGTHPASHVPRGCGNVGHPRGNVGHPRELAPDGAKPASRSLQNPA
jgi:hypothetical protein